MTTLNMSDDVRRLNPELAGVDEYIFKPAHGKVRKGRLLLDDGFDSQLEREFNIELNLRGYEVKPHGLTLHLPGGVNYTPDFVAWTGEVYPLVIVFEVKGNLKMKNARDSRTRFKIAAGLYPCFMWVWVTRARDGRWCETTVRNNGK